jgi:ATP-binding cassette subfamily B protein
MSSTADLVREKARKGLEQLPHLWRALRLVWTAAPRLTLVWGVLTLVLGLLPVVSVFLTRALVDSLVGTMGAGAGWERAREPMLLAAAAAGVLVLAEVLQALSRWIQTAQSEVVRDHMSALLQNKAIAVDLEYYESAQYFDQLHLIRHDVQQRPLALLRSVGGMVQHLLTLASMLVVLARFGIGVPILLVVSTAPAVLALTRYMMREYAWRLRALPEERRAMYFDYTLTGAESAAEVRLFGLGPHFQAIFRMLRGKLRRERLQLARDEGLTGLVAGMLGLAVTGGALAWMVWQALEGRFTLGSLAMFYQAFSQGQRLMGSMLENLSQIYLNSLFLGNFFGFQEIESKIATPPAPVALRACEEASSQALSVAAPPDIRFRGVTFRYPGSDRPALDRFDLDVPAGRIAAIVGANGAGKSTLVKLICRLYDPEAGTVEIGGADARTLDLEALRRAIAVLFQQHSRYALTMRENIALGDLGRATDAAGVEAAARAAGADEPASRLPRGYDTLLSKWFAGGAELSVGEWQRVALARAFFRDASIVLLDEPTSAMDSWAEAEWLDRFRALVQGRTALIVTHRFTTAMRADVIHVMHAGALVESGTHAELLARGGRYAKSWRAQMRHAETAASS